jgi:hypothetical protein
LLLLSHTQPVVPAVHTYATSCTQLRVLSHLRPRSHSGANGRHQQPSAPFISSHRPRNRTMHCALFGSHESFGSVHEPSALQLQPSVPSEQVSLGVTQRLLPAIDV